MPTSPSPVLFRPGSKPPVGPQRPYGYPAVAAPLPAEIPICWLSSPVMLRMEQPYTTAAITRSGGSSPYRDASAANRAEYGDFSFTAELSTPTTADPANLAHWTITYQSTPRMRSPQLAINLMFRTDTEKLMLLRIGRWTRIKLTGVPPEFPEGASSLVVAGMKHQISLGGRMLYITTAAVIGSAAGVPGPWFRFGSSAWGGTDIIPF
jgi:hypothetical protein